MSNPETPPHAWPLELLDRLGLVVCLIDRSDMLTYANRSACKLLEESGRPLPPRPACDLVVETARAVRADGLERSEVLTFEPGPVLWRSRFLRLGREHVAIVAEPEAPAGDRPRQLVARLHIRIPDARLALRIADGWSNRAIAQEQGVSLSTLKTRASRLYRKLGVRNRAELAALVARNLTEP